LTTARDLESNLPIHALLQLNACPLIDVFYRWAHSHYNTTGFATSVCMAIAMPAYRDGQGDSSPTPSGAFSGCKARTKFLALVTDATTRLPFSPTPLSL
jgi:hypothetical protein